MAIVPFRFRRTVILDMPAEDVWKIISNTGMANRLTGLPPMQFAVTNGDLYTSLKIGSLKLTWLEKPYEWVEQKFLAGERVPNNVPAIKSGVLSYKVEPLGTQRTRVRLMLEIFPKDILGWLVLPVAVQFGIINSIKNVLIKVAKAYPQQTDHADIFAGMNKPKVNQKQLEQGFTRLLATNFDPKLIEKLKYHICNASDVMVAKMRPYAFAEQWGTPRQETARLFLQATRAGLLDLSWEVLCPNCRVTKGTFARLSELSKKAHCETCNLEFDANFDQYVELQFTVSPQIRNADLRSYCLSGPFMTPHVLAQLRIVPGETRDISMMLEAGEYRLRMRPSTAKMKIHALANPETPTRKIEIIFKGEEFTPSEVFVSADEANFSLQNQSDKEILVMLERGAWGRAGLSAAEVTTMQDFRDLFSSQVLTPGIGVEIRNLTFLFTDLKDSTAMYEKVGDSSAYSLVRDHFGVMGSVITKHNGAIVKTIGDAVMAVFSDPADAVQACLQIRSDIHKLNDQLGEQKLIIKMGLHCGACIAITANDIIDYFGSTVNIAARVQGRSIGGDIVMSSNVLESGGVCDLLTDFPCEQFETNLKGLSGKFTLFRV
jgi:class 3 adenylate cyclase